MNKETKKQVKRCRDCMYWTKWPTTKIRVRNHKGSICNLLVKATNEKDSCENWSL